MANYTFNTDEQSFSLQDGAAWDGAIGNLPGSISLQADNNSYAVLSGLSISTNAGDPVSFDFRVTVTNPSQSNTGIVATLTLAGAGAGILDSDPVAYPVGPDYDSGWIRVDTTLPGGEVTAISLTFSSQGPGTEFMLYFDNIYIAEAPPSAGYGYTHSADAIPGAIMEPAA